MTALVGILNFLVLQWLGVRVEVYVGRDGDFVLGEALFPVLPLTGWWGPYVPQRPKVRWVW